VSSATRIDCQPAYLLHSRPYRNTSLIIDVFSHDHGRVGLVVRGARTARSRWTAVLLPFQQLLLSWQGRGELKTLLAAEVAGPSCWLQGNALIGGLYGNELLLRLLQRDDPHPELLLSYQQLLHELGRHYRRDNSASLLEQVLRRFEKQLLQALGYGLLLDREARSGEPVQAEQRYYYYCDEGPVLCASATTAGFTVSGATLLALAHEHDLDAAARREAKQLMRQALRQHLGDRPLHSRRLYRGPA